MFDRIKFRGIRGQIFKGMASLPYGLLYVLTFVEGSVVHDNDRVGGKLRQKVLGEPSIKEIAIHGGINQAGG
jgi:hypothetical protein